MHLGRTRSENLDRATCPIQGQYYWGGKPVAFHKSYVAHFQHQDWLGTERMRTTYTGAVEGKFTSLPFGDGLTTTSGTDLDPNHYAMLDHDAETNTDHAEFRQYSNTQGRFMSPDPYDGSYNPGNPQSFNRYVYAMNNPLSNVDPSGLECVWDDGSYDDNNDPETGSPSQCAAAGGTWVDHANFAGMPAWCSDGDTCGYDTSLPNALWDPNAPSNGSIKSPARQQCEANAQQAFDSTRSTLNQGFWGQLKSSAGEGFVGGAIVGCIASSEIGCFEGAAPGAVIGALSGASVSTYHYIWNNGPQMTDARQQYQQAMQACMFK